MVYENVVSKFQWPYFKNQIEKADHRGKHTQYGVMKECFVLDFYWLLKVQTDIVEYNLGILYI